jgi:hypothetical protein
MLSVCGDLATPPTVPARAATAKNSGSRGRFEQTVLVPSRRRPKPPKSEPQDPVVQFATLLRESAERERAEEDRRRRERQQARDAAARAAAHADALDAARGELEHAIIDARAARRAGAGVSAADAAWRHAKARLIELETGEPPDWARPDASPAPEADDSSDGLP